MKRFKLSLREIDKKKLLRQRAQESDTEIVHSEPGVYCLGKTPVILYGKLQGKTDAIRVAIQKFPVKQEVRSSNINRFGGNFVAEGKAAGLGESGIFGFRPRVPFASNFCSVASSAQTFPKEHEEICRFGKTLDRLYEGLAPDVAAHHRKILDEQIRPDWVIPATRFTSGIVNHNNSLRYHYDRGNLFGVMSCMIVFRQLCSGGYLSLPEFNARWLLEDGSYFFFDGQSYLHGVTPISKLNKNGYRYSVVYYALRAMGKCGSISEEVERCRKEKRKREKARVGKPSS